jgi:hypothetical protein
VFRVAGAAVSDMSSCSMFRAWYYIKRALSGSATEVFDLHFIFLAYASTFIITESKVYTA